MPAVQTTYSESMALGVPGMLVNADTVARISRTIESAAGIAFGQPAFQGTGDHGVIAGATQAGTAVSAAVAGNVGNGTMGAVTISAGAKVGIYRLIIVEPGANVGTFVVEDPDGNVIGSGAVATAFSAGGLAFTLADGATDFLSGDSFTITVTATANALMRGIVIKDIGVNFTTADVMPQYSTASPPSRGRG